MSNLIHNLLVESTQSAHAVDGRPTLVSITRAVNDLIYEDLVAIQPTEMPQAALYGLRYKNPNGVMTFTTPATYSGKYGDRSSIELITETTNLVQGKIYKDANDVVYECLKAQNMAEATGSTLQKKVDILIMKSGLRYACEVSPVDYTDKREIAQSQFKLDLWKVNTGNRKFKLDISHELLHDMKGNGINGNNLVGDLLSTAISEEVNKDIIQTIQTVSHRYNTPETPEGILALDTITDDPMVGRNLYKLACTMGNSILRDTSYEAKWIIASPAVAGYLQSSGFMRKDPTKPVASGVLANGLYVYVDAFTTHDYMVVGTKHQTQTSTAVDDVVGSLFYSPFTEVDEAGSFKFVSDPDSLQPSIMCHARYGLSVNPYTAKDGQPENESIKGDDWAKLAGRSPYSEYVGIILPDEK